MLFAQTGSHDSNGPNRDPSHHSCLARLFTTAAGGRSRLPSPISHLCFCRDGCRIGGSGDAGTRSQRAITTTNIWPSETCSGANILSTHRHPAMTPCSSHGVCSSRPHHDARRRQRWPSATHDRRHTTDDTRQTQALDARNSMLITTDSRFRSMSRVKYQGSIMPSISWGRGGSAISSLKGKHAPRCLPCLPTIGRTNRQWSIKRSLPPFLVPLAHLTSIFFASTCRHLSHAAPS
ncbi:hypothetical protein B0T18DRAFT_171286 [Schizothecium vesticola]|uniref:Uncharacterized protein n=1 Tax=Schizothecium vesticola TaxID=314040 RepID=A0AA40EP06_9PEZI|nr:hypothetical protein B0T18DRAFT_171286 [Schizothecium vesticola]